VRLGADYRRILERDGEELLPQRSSDGYAMHGKPATSTAAGSLLHGASTLSSTGTGGMLLELVQQK